MLQKIQLMEKHRVTTPQLTLRQRQCNTMTAQRPFHTKSGRFAICVDKPRVPAVYFDISDCEYDVPLHIVPEDLPVQDLRLSWAQDQASPWLAWRHLWGPPRARFAARRSWSERFPVPWPSPTITTRRPHRTNSSRCRGCLGHAAAWLQKA